MAAPCSSSAHRAGAPRGGWRYGALRRCAGSRSSEAKTSKTSPLPMARRYE
uniref:Uncharacterized protein n=1 Tax=Arundo donax TaxID=35708 RepID=A0A0A9BTP0_ARUDO